MRLARASASPAAVGFDFHDLDATADEEAIHDDEEAAGAEICCGTKPAGTRPGAPISIRGNAPVVGN
eukprot:3264911-Prorocentrum_lima.AAC.1